MLVFQNSVEQHFGKVAQSFDSNLERISPRAYGFVTKQAVVTLGVEFGHFPGISVNLRERRLNETRAADDDTSIGLAVVVRFSEPLAPA